MGVLFHSWELVVFTLLSGLYLVAGHDRPIIGILAEETSSGYGDTIIPTAYVKYLMMGGARVVGVRAKEPESYYQNLFQKINGLLLQGGRLSTMHSEYARSARIMFQLAMEANAAGDYFPIWGICLGSQVLVNIVAGANKLSSTPGMKDISLPLNFTSAASSTRLLEDIPGDTLEALKTEPITYNTHNYGVRAEKFRTVSRLRDFYTVVSTNMDSNGVEFVSMYEAKNRSIPVYGSQWHPEKPSFDWNPQRSVNHSLNAIKAAQYFANFFVQEARQSSHKFASTGEEEKALIQTERRRFFQSGKFIENFYIDYSD